MGALNIGRMCADPLKCRLIAIDEINLDLHHLAAGAMFYHLEIVPVSGWPLVEGWTATSTIGWHLPPSLDHRLAISPFAVGGHGRWRLRVAAIFELLHQLLRHCFFGLGDGKPDP